METISIRADDIELGGRHRALSEDAVQRLAGSMREIGLKQPISVRVVDEMLVDGQMCNGVPVLVAGAHRLAAAKALGWSHIDCIEVEDDPVAAELWEIAENLHRCDLTKDQRDEHIRRYAELLTKRAEVSGQSDRKPKSGPQGGRPKEIATMIAEETGLSQRTVRRALNPQPRPEVVPIAARSEEDAILAQANAIVSAWNRACPAAREIALTEIDAPVFDRTRAA